MEWIVTTGESIEEAKDRALDQLGVAPEDAEFIVVQEASTKLFGFRKTAAEVRARVRPVAPPAKQERPQRRSKGREGRKDRGSRGKKTQSSDGKVSDGKVSGGKVSDGKVSGGKVSDGDSSGDRQSRDAQSSKRQAGNTQGQNRERQGKQDHTGQGRNKQGQSKQRDDRSRSAGADDDGAPKADVGRRTRKIGVAGPSPVDDGGAQVPSTPTASSEAGSPGGRRRRTLVPSTPKPATNTVETTAASFEPPTEASTIAAPEKQATQSSGDTGTTRRRTINPLVAAKAARTQEQDDVSTDVSVDDQQAMVGEFLQGLAVAFGVTASSEMVASDEDSFEVNLAGDNADLGLLIGPRGQHLVALHEVTKTMLQRRMPGQDRARVRVDVGGYRARRRVALEGYVGSLIDGVKDSGVEKGLEPMNSADRKVVHDTVNSVDGVRTISVGEEPRRRVVIVPEGN
ncbi:MAG: R3H domain-containing nucleic acid-binding protein [Acidimicrobiales bacterium]